MVYENPKAVATAILKIAGDEGLSVTPMQLQKLLYFVNGWFLEMNNGKDLFLDKFEAWTWGPVMPSIYQAFKSYGSSPINDTIMEGRIKHEGVELLITDVIRIYGKLGGVQMSMLTHKEGTPWQNTWQNGLGKGFDIPNKLIVEEFSSIREKSQVA